MLPVTQLRDEQTIRSLVSTRLHFQFLHIINSLRHLWVPVPFYDLSVSEWMGSSYTYNLFMLKPQVNLNFHPSRAVHGFGCGGWNYLACKWVPVGKGRWFVRELEDQSTYRWSSSSWPNYTVVTSLRWRLLQFQIHVVNWGLKILSRTP